MTPTDIERKIESIRRLLGHMGKDGRWSRDYYSVGLYNGLELALATLEERQAVYKNPPKELLGL